MRDDAREVTGTRLQRGGGTAPAEPSAVYRAAIAGAMAVLVGGLAALTTPYLDVPAYAVFGVAALAAFPLVFTRSVPSNGLSVGFLLAALVVGVAPLATFVAAGWRWPEYATVFYERTALGHLFWVLGVLFGAGNLFAVAAFFAFYPRQA